MAVLLGMCGGTSFSWSWCSFGWVEAFLALSVVCVCVCVWGGGGGGGLGGGGGGGGGVGLWDVSRVESSTRAPRLSSFILLGSSSDTLLMVSILDMVSAFSVLVGVKEVKAEFILAVFLYKKLSTWSMASSWRGILTGKLATNFFFLLPMFNLII